MPRQTQAKCIECSRLSSQEAQRLHGDEGDGCWQPNICHRRRSHYRNRADNNAKRRGQRAILQTQLGLAKPQAEVATIAVPIQLPAIALIYLYREARKDAHLHAIAVTVWRGDEKLAEMKPIHCMGMTNRQVNQYLREVLSALNQQYAIKEFEPEIRMEPSECPLAPCPLRNL